MNSLNLYPESYNWEDIYDETDIEVLSEPESDEDDESDGECER
jgi:hypothetical protein